MASINLSRGLRSDEESCSLTLATSFGCKISNQLWPSKSPWKRPQKKKKKKNQSTLNELKLITWRRLLCASYAIKGVSFQLLIIWSNSNHQSVTRHIREAIVEFQLLTTRSNSIRQSILDFTPHSGHRSTEINDYSQQFELITDQLRVPHSKLT